MVVVQGSKPNLRRDVRVDGGKERQLLVSGASALGLRLDEPECRQLLDFLQLIVKWNRTINLTSVTDPEQMVVRHLLDSLTVLGNLEGQTVLDLGSGAGLPGVPLAVLSPERRFTLLDSRSKRTAFLQQVKVTLALANVTVVTARAESLVGTTFDTVVVRAFGTLSRICAAARNLITDQGIIVAMKGSVSEAEVVDLPAGMVVREVREIAVPGLAAARNLVVMARG